MMQCYSMQDEQWFIAFNDPDQLYQEEMCAAIAWLYKKVFSYWLAEG